MRPILWWLILFGIGAMGWAALVSISLLRVDKTTFID